MGRTQSYRASKFETLFPRGQANRSSIIDASTIRIISRCVDVFDFRMRGILMEFRGLYETGIKTRNIRSVREAIRLLRSIKIQSRVRTAYRERRCDWNFYRWNPFTIQSWENYARSKLIFNGWSVWERACSWPPVIIKNLRTNKLIIKYSTFQDQTIRSMYKLF